MTPFKGTNRVTSPYGWRTLNGKREMHRGQDIVPTKIAGDNVPENAWEVREVTGGTVLRVTSDNSRGKYVDVQTAPRIFERYQHMQSICVKVGQKVKQGDLLGIAGNTGKSTGRHLHFGVYKNGTLEKNAVYPQQWSGLPNTAGAYKGNDALNVPATTNTLRVLAIGPMSGGDCKMLESLAKTLGLPCIASFFNAMTILTIGPMSAGDLVTIRGKADELALKVDYK